jgi:hypothetical protein
MKRAVHIDFHTMPGIHDFNRDWDAARFARTLADAHVGYINAFARCNIGFAYYPTKIGTSYPGMKGDMFGDLLHECRKLGIGVSAYFNVGLCHDPALRHPEWLRVDGEGRIIRGDRTANFFRTICFNNPDFKAYHFAMLEEVRAYDPDGYFFDCMCTEPCYCRHCMEKMKAQGVDPYDEKAHLAFQERCVVEFSEGMRRIIGEGKYLYLNGLHYEKARHLNTHMEVECLPSGWGYDFFWPNASYVRNMKETVLYMTGRFQINWGDFGGFKTKASLEHDFYDALCAGVGVSVGDHMHPAGNLDREVYKTVGELNEMIMALEPYTEKAGFLADIGVVVNAERAAASFAPDDIGFLPEYISGVARMFGELRQSYDVINETMDFGKYRVLVLPDRLRMNEALRGKLAQFLASGGRVLSSGTAGLNAAQDGFALPEWDFRFLGVDASNSSYFRIVGNEDPMLPRMDYCMYSDSGTLFTGGRVLAKYVKAYFDRRWDGFHGYFYTPPEKETEYAAAAVNGAGNVCHISFEVFRSYYKSAAYADKALVKKCLDNLLPDPLLYTRGVPSTARVTATGCEEYTLLHAKVTYPEVRGRMNIVEEHAVLKEGASVFVRGDYMDACMLPEKEPVQISRSEGGYTKVRLPEIVGYKTLLLRK